MTTSLPPPSTTERLREQCRRYLSIYLPGNHQALLPTDSLIEVLTFTPSQVVAIPDTPDQVMGVSNWRGEVLWLVDAGYLLQDQPSFYETNYQTKFNVVVLQRQHQSLGLVVERVGNMLWCHPNDFQSLTPAIFDASSTDSTMPDNMATRCLIGAWPDETGEPLLVFDAEAILNLFV